MKKGSVKRILIVLGLCLAASLSFATETRNTDECQAAAIAYVEYFGGGDSADVVYDNVYTRFVPAQEESPAFWFYVYQKGKIWLCEGAKAEDYKDLPEYVTVRVYEGDQEKDLRSKYNVYNAGYIITNHGDYTTFYFEKGGQAHFVLNYLKPNTTVLSAVLPPSLSGRTLSGFEVDSSLRRENCGEETPKFIEMLNAVTLL